MIFLDTNVVVGLLNGREPRLRRRYDVARWAGAPLALSTVALFELRYGAANSARPEANARVLDAFLDEALRVIPFAAEDAAEAGAVRAELRRQGTPIGPYDVLIAAQARRAGAILVTANTGEFTRVAGLGLEDWGAA